MTWKIWIDTGGTFTDCVALDPEGRVRLAKVLSSSALRGIVHAIGGGGELHVREPWAEVPGLMAGCGIGRIGAAPIWRVISHEPAAELRLESAHDLRIGDVIELRSDEEAPVLAARLVTRTPAREPLPPLSMRLATTRGTNALLERRGVPPAVFVTAGFGDLLRIGDQRRPDLFALEVKLPQPLYGRVVEVPERISASGEVLRPLAVGQVEAAGVAALEAGFRNAAVVLANAYRNSDHERRVEELLLGLGFEHVSRSSALTTSIGLLPRARTAVVDAYLAPVLLEYLAGVERGIGSGRRSAGTLHLMTSAGGLAGASDFRPRDSLLSGPAGGVVGAASAARAAGLERVITFDMGGTSTDVARYDGDYSYVWEHRVGDAELVAPALAVESVAAGGGSVCTVDANGLRVGPESAGAVPGPACYGAGGPLTLTDVNLLLGRLDPAGFGIPVSLSDARTRANQLLRAVRERRGDRTALYELLEGLVAIADERMADAIRSVSVRKGYDPAEYTLVAFGGAGGQHACGVARRLGIRQILIPADAGLLSATGLGQAVLERFAEKEVLRPVAEVLEQIGGWLAELEREAGDQVRAEAGDAVVATRRRMADVRFLGQETALTLPATPVESLEQRFDREYGELYGHLPEDRAAELVTLRVVASTTLEPRDETTYSAPPAATHPRGRTRVYAGGWKTVDRFDWRDLRPGAAFKGPALVREPHSAVLVPDEGWSARMTADGSLLLRLETAEEKRLRARPASVEEELFTARFEALVGEMGDMLRRTALSTNVKERLDFSCALLDAGGELVANAPHIPVHLGALGLCVRSVAAKLELGPGDVALTNHPAFGGSHLPDVTLIAPVHQEAELIGYVANRAHHAELGGSRPGSMPPDATRLAEEGVVIPPIHLVRRDQADWSEIRRLLTESRWPSRAPSDNLADLAAQLAAVRRGSRLLRELAARFGSETVRHHMRALTGRAELRSKEALQSFGEGELAAMERLDDGSELRVRLRVRGGRLSADFSGSAAIHPANLNATPAIVRSVLLYVLRLLIREPLPLNEGLLRPVEILLPRGILNPSFEGPPEDLPAVVGGNTEVSQRLVDLFIRALDLAACSQGTMNNVLWGTREFGYYETIGGGVGAGPGWHGASAVHSHMTNTRITDVEVLEHRYPVRVERFAIRAGSGGEGEYRGGDGIVREVTFLAPMQISLLTQHRIERPYGMQGGGPGACGAQRLVRADGSVVQLRPSDGEEVRPGDRLIVETPGGGAWGAPVQSITSIEASSG